jgi:hypothetical protein
MVLIIDTSHVHTVAERTYMTKKDYIRIADAVKKGSFVDIEKTNDHVLNEWNVRYAIVDAIVEALASDNPRFNKEKFYSRMGIIPPTHKTKQVEGSALSA